MVSRIGWAKADIDIPIPERIWDPGIEWQGLSPWLDVVSEDGRAFDQCFCCGLAMCEDGGDYVEWQCFEADGDHGTDPDPVWVTLCEDCASLDWLDLFPFEEDEDY